MSSKNTSGCNLVRRGRSSGGGGGGLWSGEQGRRPSQVGVNTYFFIVFQDFIVVGNSFSSVHYKLSDICTLCMLLQSNSVQILRR